MLHYYYVFVSMLMEVLLLKIIETKNDWVRVTFLYIV